MHSSPTTRATRSSAAARAPLHFCAITTITRITPAAAARYAEPVATFVRNIFAETYGSALPADTLARYLARHVSPDAIELELRDPQASTLVATIGASIIATARLARKVEPPCVPEMQAIEISRFYVAAPLRGSGVAHNLIRACETEAVARNAPAVWLCAWERNARAVAFYTRAGFEIVGSTTIMVGDVAFHDHVLHKSLT